MPEGSIFRATRSSSEALRTVRVNGVSGTATFGSGVFGLSLTSGISPSARSAAQSKTMSDRALLIASPPSGGATEPQPARRSQGRGLFFRRRRGGNSVGEENLID